MRQRPWVWPALMLLAATAPRGHSSEWGDFSMDARMNYGSGGSDDVAMEQTLQAEPSLRQRYSDYWTASISARLRLDFADDLEPGGAPVENYSSISEPLAIDDLGTLELRDVYLERAWANGRVRLGKQQVVWGRLDGLKILDVLNPQNLREFILEDFGESRIGLWSAYVDWSQGNWRLELAAIPDNTGHVIPDPGAWFELTAPRYRYGADPDSPAPPIRTDRGGLSVDDSAIGARVSARFLGLDVSGVAYSGLDHEPLGRVLFRDDRPVVERFYRRRELYGLSLETAVGAFAIRAELAHQPNRTFNTREPGALETVELDQNTAALGLDIAGPLDTFINVQYLYDHVRSAPGALVRPDTDKITTVFLRRSFAYETVDLTARWYYSSDLDDQMLSVGLRYAFSDNSELRLTADIFSGDEEGPFGQFADRDRVTVLFSHTF